MLVKIISVMLKNTFTTDDLVERLSLMRLYYGKRLFTSKGDIPLDRVIGGSCEAHTLHALEEWQNSFHEQSISPLIVYEALDAIEEDLGGLPSVTVYVPIHFLPSYVEGFGKWFRENVQPNLLLTLRTDPHMSGGCGFVWKDVQHDLSLHYFIQKHRNDIVSMFNEYTKHE